MITATEKFSYKRIDDNTLSLIVNGKTIETVFIGRRIEAQYQVGEWYLIVLQADPTKIMIYLLDENFQVLDEQGVGHWYFDCIFEDPEIVQPDTLKFIFGTRGEIKVLEQPQKPGLFKKKRHLQCSGVGIEA